MGERGRGQSSLQEKTVSVSGINSGEELASGKQFLSFTEFAGIQQGGEALPPSLKAAPCNIYAFPLGVALGQVHGGRESALSTQFLHSNEISGRGRTCASQNYIMRLTGIFEGALGACSGSLASALEIGVFG